MEELMRKKTTGVVINLELFLLEK